MALFDHWPQLDLYVASEFLDLGTVPYCRAHLQRQFGWIQIQVVRKSDLQLRRLKVFVSLSTTAL